MEKIWVIEDDESIRGELQKLLRANGYQPVEGQPCDLVLLDINLPGENGFEICQKIRRQSDVPVIFLTARDSREDLAWALTILSGSPTTPLCCWLGSGVC